MIKSVVDTSDNTPSDILYLQDLKSFVGWGSDVLKVYNAAGRTSWQASQMGLEYETVAISPDHRWLAAAASDTTVSIRNVSDDQEVRQLAGNPGVGKSILFFQDGRRLAVGNSDGTSAIWSTETDQLLATTVHGTSGEWLTITPEGFFVASAKGAELLHVVSGFTTIGIDQVYQSLYRPDLVQQKLAGDPAGKVKEAAAKLDLDKVIGSGAAPKVSIVSPEDRSPADGDEVAVYEGEQSIVDKGIDQARLQAWFAQIPARRSVLLFDTCESGTLTGEKTAQRGLERVAALDRMTQAMGRTVLSASTDDAPALEGYRGHGVFTYAVLDALGAADTNGNGTIEVTELASFVDQKVPELSYEAFRQRQVPQMKIVGSNFTLSNKVAVAAKDEASVDAVPSKPTCSRLL